jgi:hypothetical protein
MTNQPTASEVPAQVENLQSQQCWELVRQVSGGRLAVWIDDTPISSRSTTQWTTAASSSGQAKESNLAAP